MKMAVATGLKAMVLALLAGVMLAQVAWGAGLTGVARVDAERSRIEDAGSTISVSLGLSQPVPYRVSTLDDPPRVVLDFHEADWHGLDILTLSRSQHVIAVRAGILEPGWSRMVIELDGPYSVRNAEMATKDQNGRAEVRLALVPTDEAAFRASAGAVDPSRWTLPKPADLGSPKRRQTGDAPLVVVLDPGHGGIDPGSVNGSVHEADIALQFARELKDVLLRAGGFKVVMTRDSDVFVPLEMRLSVAHAVGADLFMSIHADALSEGEATGATVYTLAAKASDQASLQLAERHDRDDMLAGVDLTNQDDQIAGVLMDMARTENAPRSTRLATDLVSAIKGAGIEMYKHPHEEAAFSVLKSPDIPSVLVELGFLSSAGDLKSLQDPAWRAKMANAILVALRKWAAEDAAEAALVRQ